MRIFSRAVLTTALFMLAGAGGAAADGWSDSTSYRNLGWTNSTSDYTVRSASGHAHPTARSAQPRASASRSVVVAGDEDRPQRRSRTARPAREPVASASVASSGSSGGTSGIASYYWQPQRVASGGWFNPNAMTAAHKTLPFGTRVRVTNMSNGRSVDVTINDRGPYIAGRIIDLSKAAAGAINMTGQGIARVQMTVLGR
jgi:rare lipoprotein A